MPSSVVYDAVLLVSFGGPERRQDVMPYLEHVLAGRNVPEVRKREVAEHYDLFGGASPINEQNRRLRENLEQSLAQSDLPLPVYWGNRHWHPFLEDTIGQMASDGVRNALVLVTSAFGSYSSCRQYVDAWQAAARKVGPKAPRLSKVRSYFNHPGFIDAWVVQATAALDVVPAERRDATRVLFSAHSIPIAMAEASDYVDQLMAASELVAERLGVTADRWQLVYQSRSGPAHQPWLEPSIVDAVDDLARGGTTVKDIVVIPIGFVSDHMEVLFDLGVEAKEAAANAGLNFSLAQTPGNHRLFVQMLGQLVAERCDGRTDRPVVGRLPAAPDECPADCCPAPRRPRVSST